MSVRTDFWKGVPGGVDSDGSGRFVRRDSIFRRWVSNTPGAEFPAEPGRYHLYVSLGCPWANRTVTVRALKGLQDVVGLSVVDPVRDLKGWAFRDAPGATGDPINGFRYLSEAYERSLPGYDDRYSVPVLWDRVSGQIVNNESSEIIVMLNGAFDEWAAHPEVDLYPAGLMTAHSAFDDQLAYSQITGAVSIVLPQHARLRPSPLDGTVHLKTETHWKALDAGNAADFIHLVPSQLDFRRPEWTAFPTATKAPSTGFLRRLRKLVGL